MRYIQQRNLHRETGRIPHRCLIARLSGAAAIRKDYEDRNYLWTGDLQPDIYEDNCRCFSDCNRR